MSNAGQMLHCNDTLFHAMQLHFFGKGSTINDLGGHGGRIENGFIFSAGIFSLRRASKIFFSQFPPPPPDH